MTHSIIPISNILKSPVVNNYLAHKPNVNSQEEFFIGDFGSGRNAEVPLFFTKEIQHIAPHGFPKPTVYCNDMHTLRLENMFGQFQEEGITSNARVVHAKMETMSRNASFPYEQNEYLKKHPQETTSLDQQILNEKRLPPACFHLGIMNKDLIGYLSEYYKTDADMKTSLQSICDTLNENALLIVTQPCMMYCIDNLKILRENGFQIFDIIDVDLETGTPTVMDENTSIDSFSKPNHYSFIVVSCK